MPPRKRATRIPPQTFPAIPIRIPSAKAALRACSSPPLRGKNGKESVTTDATGKVTSTTVTEPPEAGDSVWHPDSNVQRAAVNALAEQIEAKPTEDCEGRCGCRLGREHRRHHRQRDLPEFRP